jgi:hypothetical protein
MLTNRFRGEGLEKPENYNQQEMDDEFQVNSADGFSPLTKQAQAAVLTEMISKLNPGQKAAYDTIVASLGSNATPDQQKQFFVEGEGGCGKNTQDKA